MTRFDLTAGDSLDNRAIYTTTPMTPHAGRLVLAFVLSARKSQGAAATPTASGNGLTWELVETATSGVLANRRLTCFRALGTAPVSGSVAFDFDDQTQDLCAWSVFEYDDVDTGGNGSAAVTQRRAQNFTAATALSAPLAPFENPVRNIAVGGIALDLLDDPARPIQAGAGFQEIHERTPNNPADQGATLQTQDRVGPGPVEWTWEAAESGVAIVLEIRTAPAVNPPPSLAETLARTFEPILFLHPAEQSMPSDAQRYVENAALWRAAMPFDSKASWGGPGPGFPRQPAVATGKIRTEDDGTSYYLGNPQYRDSSNQEHFLQFGGWKDASGVPQPEVTSASSHPYSDRGASHARYTGEPELSASRFWYHAELFETDRLRVLVETVRAPDLLKTFHTFRNPAVLCYYLLFPGHEQRVGTPGTCPNVAATEVGSFAGEWGCIALLLERDDPQAEYHPSFVGHTGSRTPSFNLASTTVRRPQAFDDERRSNLKVERWRPAGGLQLPELSGTHPHFYVALGTHSLYMEPGSHPVDPFPDDVTPRVCGTYDGGPASIPGEPMPVPDAAIIVKLVGGPVGWLALAAEALIGYTAFGEGRPADPVPPDQAPATGSGKTLHPAGLVVPGHWADPEPWRSAQGVEIDGRTYDFLVDRQRQVWWPGDDGRTGFHGRWGERVEDDPFGRRAGMRFPPFWKMLLLGIEDGRANGMLD
jgi:hypothetical protein